MYVGSKRISAAWTSKKTNIGSIPVSNKDKILRFCDNYDFKCYRLLIALSVLLPEVVPLVWSSSEDPLEVCVSINFGMFRHEETRSTRVT